MDFNKKPKQQSDDYKSHDAFMPRVDVNKEIANLMFFSTTHNDIYRSRDSRLCAGTSVKEVHGPNAGSENYVRGTAPLADRDSLSYNRDYIKRPLDGVAINSECRLLFQEKSTTPATKPVAGLKQTAVTETHEVFKDFTRNQMKGAKPPNFKPKQEQHVRTEVPFHTMRPTSQHHHQGLSKRERDMAKTLSCKPSKPVHVIEAPFRGKTAYNRQFNVDAINLKGFGDANKRQPRNISTPKETEERAQKSQWADVEGFTLSQMVQYCNEDQG